MADDCACAWCRIARRCRAADQIAELLITSPLPDYPDYSTVEAWLVSAYQRAWALA